LEVEASGYAVTHSPALSGSSTAITGLQVQMAVGAVVRGEVVDDSGISVSNALVTIRRTGATAREARPQGSFVLYTKPTSGTGTFAFDGLAAGDYDIIVRKMGYTPQKRNVFVAVGESREERVILRP
jgi:hypothetical protein